MAVTDPIFVGFCDQTFRPLLDVLPADYASAKAFVTYLETNANAVAAMALDGAQAVQAPPGDNRPPLALGLVQAVYAALKAYTVAYEANGYDLLKKINTTAVNPLASFRDQILGGGG